jgi:hypothetical protein
LLCFQYAIYFLCAASTLALLSSQLSLCRYKAMTLWRHNHDVDRCLSNLARFNNTRTQKNNEEVLATHNIRLLITNE